MIFMVEMESEFRSQIASAHEKLWILMGLEMLTLHQSGGGNCCAAENVHGMHYLLLRGGMLLYIFTDGNAKIMTLGFA